MLEIKSNERKFHNHEIDVLSTKPEDMEFHRHRRMFVITEDDLIVAPPNLTMSHKEWFLAEPKISKDWHSKECLMRFLDETVRGFHERQTDTIYIYTGNGFYFDDSTLKMAKRFLLSIVARIPYTSLHTRVVLGPKHKFINGVRYSQLHRENIKVLHFDEGDE